LKIQSYQIDQLVVTANKYATDIREIASSSYVLDQKIFSEKNFRQIDEALRYVPGISMISDQISIRGSSGYGRGAGTRVLILVDGIPIYTPDSGDIIWELVPTSEIERVEIIKGSVSSLYGSSAIGGVINIITKETSSNPLTYVQLQGGVYNKPSHEEWEWTDGTMTYNSQVISHSRSFGKISIAGSFSRLEYYSYRKNDYQLRFAGFLKANYHFTKSTSLAFMGTGYTRDKGTFNYWKDIKNALSPPDFDIGQSTGSAISVFGFTFNHIINKDFSITLIPSSYISYWNDDSDNRNRSNSKLYRSEISTNYKFSGKLTFISGTEF
jgi:iron complex outermembrane receptor protein